MSFYFGPDWYLVYGAEITALSSISWIIILLNWNRILYTW